MLEVRPVNYEQWDDFVEISPQGTIFCSTTWCGLFQDDYIVFGCYKGDELVGGIIGFEKDGVYVSGSYPLTMYQGILTKNLDKYTSQMSLHNQVAESLINDYPAIVQNHYTYPDIRPFLWAGWIPQVKYTYVVKPDKEKLDKDTRYEIGRGEGIIGGCSADEFITLYHQTFNRKELEMPVTDDWLHNFWGIMKPKAFRNSTAAVIFIEDSKRAYYILGASNGGNYKLLWESINQFKEVDMVGCNVKEIGLFKRGFGGELKVSLGATNV